jgi:hypothetical protein
MVCSRPDAAGLPVLQWDRTSPLDLRVGRCVVGAVGNDDRFDGFSQLVSTRLSAATVGVVGVMRHGAPAADPGEFPSCFSSSVTTAAIAAPKPAAAPQ